MDFLVEMAAQGDPEIVNATCVRFFCLVVHHNIARNDYRPPGFCV